MSLLRRVIGGVLRRIRTRQGRTLREVAEAAGVSLPYLSEVERGRKEASSEVLAAICRALGIRLSDLLEEARDDLRQVEPRTPVGPRAAVAALPLPRYGDRLSRLERPGDRRGVDTHLALPGAPLAVGPRTPGLAHCGRAATGARRPVAV
ncbi:Transcriptional regulator ClgR [Micromonospora sp. MW-13]|uniref:helix-turn-helix domain-containing protein n=1 Tax=Micromonospora sp. MW-13 TaxID=2094022 RepID=UPI000EBF6916|nr:Transcriptional regulator ClgR [Micromonospora sp. MW-13]